MRIVAQRLGNSEFDHGYSGYTNHGCRCRVCVDAGADYNHRAHLRRDYRSKPTPSFETSGAVN